jgi:head-tail adaptor
MAPPDPVLRESIEIQENLPDPVPVATLTRTSATATVTTATPHGFTTGDFVQIAGTTPTGYGGKVKITVTGPTTFTYPVLGTLATPATGTITVTYVSDAQGGRKIGWEALRTIHAEAIPVKAWEKLQVQALQGQLDYRFRIHTVDAGGITDEMRIVWTPQWPAGSPVHTLEISGILPDRDGRQFVFLEAGETV